MEKKCYLDYLTLFSGLSSQQYLEIWTFSCLLLQTLSITTSISFTNLVSYRIATAINTIQTLVYFCSFSSFSSDKHLNFPGVTFAGPTSSKGFVILISSNIYTQDKVRVKKKKSFSSWNVHKKNRKMSREPTSIWTVAEICFHCSDFCRGWMSVLYLWTGECVHHLHAWSSQEVELPCTSVLR